MAERLKHIFRAVVILFLFLLQGKSAELFRLVKTLQKPQMEYITGLLPRQRRCEHQWIWPKHTFQLKNVYFRCFTGGAKKKKKTVFQ